MPEETQQFTQLLHEWSGGKKEALDQLMPVIYDELRKLAGRYLYSERRDHTLRATALVNEAYLRLIDQQRVQWKDRTHFYGIAARVMRQVLVDYARKRRADKRGMLVRTDFSVSQLADPGHSQDLDALALHDALNALAELDPREAEIVELRYFGGLTEEEVATVTHLSPATIRREIATARFWLGRRMRGER